MKSNDLFTTASLFIGVAFWSLISLAYAVGNLRTEGREIRNMTNDLENTTRESYKKSHLLTQEMRAIVQDIKKGKENLTSARFENSASTTPRIVPVYDLEKNALKANRSVFMQKLRAQSYKFPSDNLQTQPLGNQARKLIRPAK
jgi:hypothetical protein